MSFIAATDRSGKISTAAIENSQSSKLFGTADDRNAPDRAEIEKFANIAAASAVALERGGFNPLISDRQPSARDYLDKETGPYHFLSKALSRVIAREQASASERSPGELVKDVVSDVLQVTSARHVVMAVGNKGLLPSLSEGQHELAKMGRESIEFLRDLSAIATGSFNRLSPEMADGLKIALEQPLPGKLGTETELVGKALDSMLARTAGMQATFDKSNDGLFPRFVPVSEESLQAVEDRHILNRPTGNETIDAALDIVFDREFVPMNYDSNHPAMIAQARLVEEGMDRFSQSPADLAAMAITDARIMQDARFGDPGPDLPKAERQALGNGEYHDLDPSLQERVAHDIMTGAGVSPLDRVRLEISQIEKGAQPLSISRESEAIEVSSAIENKPAMDPLVISAQMAAQARGMGM